MTMITSAIFGHFSTDLIVSSIKHSIMNLPRQFLATFLMDKMMQTVPEELRTYLKVEWMTYIKWLCTYAIEEILMRLMKTIASALQKRFTVNTVKNIPYFFRKKLTEPIFADIV